MQSCALPVVHGDKPPPEAGALELAEGQDVRTRPAMVIAPGLLQNARAVAQALFSTETGPPSVARLDWLQADLADFLGRVGFLGRLGFRLSILATTLLAPLTLRTLRRFRGLSVEERHRALERFERSALGIAFLASKAILCILYFEHPEVTAEVGAPPALPGGA
jgi:hypothetical protein